MHSANHIFLSYRRGDTAGHVGRLYEELQQRYLADSVFMDIDGIGPGEDFVAVLDTRLADAKIVLVLIGPRWFGENADGTRRIDDEGDFVRMEVAAALARSDLTVIPLLCGGVSMPTEASLPAPLAPLARRNAFELSDLRWRVDVQRLLRAIDGLLAAAAVVPSRKPAIAFAGVAVVGLLWFLMRGATANDSGSSTDIPAPLTVEVPPMQLVQLAKEQLARARDEWIADAYVSGVQTDCDGYNGACKTDIGFESASKPIGMLASRWHARDKFTYSQSASDRHETPIPLDMMELEAAVGKARAYGMRGGLQMARVEMHTAADNREMPYWKIIPSDRESAGSERAFCLEAWTGTRVNCRQLQDR